MVGDDAIRRNLVDGEKLISIFLWKKQKRDNDVLMWNISRDWALIMHVIILHRNDLFFFLSSLFFLYTKGKTWLYQWPVEKQRWICYIHSLIE